jgi:hypothetical protein
MEYSVKAQLPLITLFCLLCAGLPALGQEAGMGGPAYTALHAAPAPTDRQSPKDADKTKDSIAESLSEHLVLFDSRPDRDNKRLGIPFTAFSNSPIHLAYDPASRQMMVQWKFGSPGLGGHTLQYQTYMDATGALNFVFNARF